ncbi:MAG TPA: hypothetical protein PLW32_14040 [Chitinophagaceae bacterium]|jgi:hypothetical protein|nr:hypothetical protein [Chitinophagaceae bacterium]MBP9741434.1 hypothetical protein [Chitinophagaceae bacterium]HPH25005.1 hypothetical protein [Chitinophagaceae bacterium]
MTIQLLEGEFNTAEGLDLISQLINIKIKYQESKINNSANEEDIKQRESKIKRLQKDLEDIRKYVANNSNKLNIQSVINLN